MSTVRESRRDRKDAHPDERIDQREALYNTGETGPVQLVQRPAELITSILGILYDFDLHLYRLDASLPVAVVGPKKFFKKTLAPWLGRHPALAGAEVRDTGRGLHAIVWFDEQVRLETDGDRDRWAGIIQVVQAALPVDPDQPGLTALTRPPGSINGKTDRPVTVLRPGTPVPVDDVLRLYEQMASAPFATVASIVFGSDRIMPCPVCRAEGSSLAALPFAGRCYGSCGTVKLEQLYDTLLAPRPAARAEGTDGQG